MAKAKDDNQEVKLILMSKGELMADVHPDEVQNYRAGGFQEVK
jgi:hypothetical protein